MGKTLGGVCWCYRAISQDYCFSEAVNSLKEICDSVVILDAGSDDGSSELVKSLQDRTTKAILCSPEEWKSVQGKEKLSYFTNKCIEQLDTDFVYSCQADEVTHQNSYNSIRRAIANDYDGYLIKRLNLWGTCDTMLNVPHNRKPCSTEILRLAKRHFRAYDDAESLMGGGQITDLFLEDIVIWHYGFVRKKEVHPEKIRHMQREIFLTTPDAKLDGMGDFEPERWFGKDDLVPVPGEHPAIMKEWVKIRP